MENTKKQEQPYTISGVMYELFCFDGIKDKLTEGKTYEVIEGHKNGYTIKDDKGDENYYGEVYFYLHPKAK